MRLVSATADRVGHFGHDFISQGEDVRTGIAGSESACAYGEVLVANTWDCNLACRYCFVDQHGLKVARTRMTPESALRLVDALDLGLAEIETVCIHLYGGEPLTNLPAIRAMIDRAAEKRAGRFVFAITTNGTLCSPEITELMDAGRFYVILSIDGPQEIHDACRRTQGGEQTHAKVVNFLKTLRSQTRCRVWGSSVVRAGWSLAQAVAYLHTLPVDAIKAQAIRACEDDALALSTQQRQDYLDHLAAIGQTVIEALEQGHRPRDHRFTSRVFQLLAGSSRERYCGAGLTSFGVTPDGAVLGCLLLDAEQNRLGHINDDPLTWRRAGADWRLRQSPRPTCWECAAMPLCGGGCPAINPICGDGECELIRKNCEVAHEIYKHFQDRPEALLGLAGIF